MTREQAIKEMIRAYDVLDFSCHMDNRRKEAFNMAKLALEQETVSKESYDHEYFLRKELEMEVEKLKRQLLEQEPILDKIFCIIHPLSIMSTPELEHKAIMQIAEMLEPLCLPESEG